MIKLKDSEKGEGHDKSMKITTHISFVMNSYLKNL